MPGSPPTNTAEPATRPPPSTRSSSAMPVLARGGGAVSPARPTKVTAFPARLLGPGRLGPACGVTASSTMVFHSPQASQRPAHFGARAPQPWQTKREVGLANAVRVRAGRLRAEWARAEWARAEWARVGWARAEWARAEWARVGWAFGRWPRARRSPAGGEHHLAGGGALDDADQHLPVTGALRGSVFAVVQGFFLLVVVLVGHGEIDMGLLHDLFQRRDDQRSAGGR